MDAATLTVKIEVDTSELDAAEARVEGFYSRLASVKQEIPTVGNVCVNDAITYVGESSFTLGQEIEAKDRYIAKLEADNAALADALRCVMRGYEVADELLKERDGKEG